MQFAVRMRHQDLHVLAQQFVFLVPEGRPKVLVDASYYSTFSKKKHNYLFGLKTDDRRD